MLAYSEFWFEFMGLFSKILSLSVIVGNPIRSTMMRLLIQLLSGVIFLITVVTRFTVSTITELLLIKALIDIDESQKLENGKRGI
jgi:hypothetical protein